MLICVVSTLSYIVLLWHSVSILTVEVEQCFRGDRCGGEHEHLQTFQALSADLCCHLLVDLTHVIQLQHLQPHAVSRWGQQGATHT